MLTPLVLLTLALLPRLIVLCLLGLTLLLLLLLTPLLLLGALLFLLCLTLLLLLLLLLTPLFLLSLALFFLRAPVLLPGLLLFFLVAAAITLSARFGGDTKQKCSAHRERKAGPLQI